MIVFIVGLVVLAVIYFLFTANHIHVDVPSFMKKTLPLDTGIFGVYCFDGKQGSGKTYSLTKYILKHANGRKIYSNMTFQKSSGIEYEPITSVNHLLSLRDQKGIVIVYDEIFTLLEKKTAIRGELQEFLSQQRKMKNILITTAQEWLNIPIDFRRYVRIQIICKTKPLGFLGGILREEYRDAYQMAWSQLENEYVAPRISLKFSKYEKKIMEAYDTHERINRLSDAGAALAGTPAKAQHASSSTITRKAIAVQ